MSARRAARLALLAYPPSFRERYGAELAGLVEDRGAGAGGGSGAAAGAGDVVDLLRGAARAWLRPVLTGDPVERLRQRRLATVSTVWVSWCAVLVVSTALLRLVEDPPPAGFRPDRGGWLVVHDIAATTLAAGWLLVLAVGVPLGLRALRQGPAVRRAVLPPVVALGGCVVLFLPLGAHADQTDPPGWWVALAVVWVMLLAVTAVWGTVGFAVGLRRAALTAGGLRLPAAAAALLVLPLAVVVVLVVDIALAGAGPAAAGPALTPLAWLGLATLLACLAASSVSAARTIAYSHPAG